MTQNELNPSRVLLVAIFAVLLSSASAQGGKKGKDGKQKPGVSFDGRSLIVNGRRELLFSGSIHYPRSTVEMWPDLIQKAKQGGLNVIQTYVFWNAHEPEEGKFNFTGNLDLVRFIRLIGENKMYVTLRVGPFIQAEWNHGGLPYWLREKKDIIFRSDNAPFKFYMERYVKQIIEMMKKEKLFAPQGGPIILAQIENEYNHVQLAYRELGVRYVQWAGNMAVGTQTGVPWVMCKQKDAPDPIINTCNGRHCGDTFIGPNKPYKPTLWTENWTAQYRVFGDPPSQRAAEDIAFSVARFFAKNGTLANYYMYHGGTNFGRTSAVFTTTRYYDEAPLDEYGLQRNPKYGHLKDLHQALKLCQRPLLKGTPTVQRMSPDLEAITFEIPGTPTCAAFLTNNHTELNMVMTFRGQKYNLPARSISILPDCKTVVYNTDIISTHHNSREFIRSKATDQLKWEMYREAIPDANKVKKDAIIPAELYSLNQDKTDYAWYTTSFNVGPHDISRKKKVKPVLKVASLGHQMLAFVNGEYIGSHHGSHIEKAFVLAKAVPSLKPGINHLTLLASTVGLPDSGAYMEHRYAGPRLVTVLGLNTGTIDLTANGWGHEVGIEGEKLQLYTEEGIKKVEWTKAIVPGPPVTWYKARFDAPEGNEPVAIMLPKLGKGMVWVNGNSIGRYWNSYETVLGEPSQKEYHIPRSFIKPKDNLLVIFDEEGGDVNPTDLVTVHRDTVCSYINERDPPSVHSYTRKSDILRAKPDAMGPAASLTCPAGKKIVAINFASFGNPSGTCGAYTLGNCDSSAAKKVVEERCLGKISCKVPVDRKLLIENGDACPNLAKTLAVEARCSP